MSRGLPNPGSRPLQLACATCGATVVTRANRDPDAGLGWPQHRCADGRVAAFDSAVEVDAFRLGAGR